MKLREAIEILKAHQQWRLGDIEDMPYSSHQITKALDVVLLYSEEYLKK